MTYIHIIAGLLAICAGALALSVRKGGWLHRRSGTVFVVGADSVAHGRAVATGIRQGHLVEIKSGLTLGDRIVVMGGSVGEGATHARKCGSSRMSSRHASSGNSVKSSNHFSLCRM
jgi:uncharacterized membrane protein